MSEHDASHEQLIQAILVGDCAREEVWSQLEGCRMCESKLEELEFVSELLTVTARGEDLSAEALPAFAAGEEAGRRRLLQLAAEEFGHLRPARRRWRPALLVGTLSAAAVLVFALSRAFDEEGVPDTPEDVFMGTYALEFLSPRADPVMPADLVFTWSGQLEDEGETFVLHLRDKAGTALAPSPVRVSEARWKPAAEVVASWPDAFEVQVSVESFPPSDATSAWHDVRLKR